MAMELSFLLLVMVRGTYVTTRKSENTNGITGGIFSSEIFNDGINSVSKVVGIYRQNYSIGIYRRYRRRRETFFEICNSVMTWIFFRRIYRRKYRGFQTRIAVQRRVASIGGITDGKFLSVSPSVKASTYWLCRHSLPLFLLLLPIFLPHPTSPLPNCSQPPIPTLPSSQHKHSSFLYFCTWSQHPLILVDFIIFCK